MDDTVLKPKFADDLVRLESGTSGPNFLRYRLQLEEKIRRAARREYRMWVVTFACALIAVFSPIAMLLIEKLVVGPTVKGYLLLGLMTATICTTPFLLLYFVKYFAPLSRLIRELTRSQKQYD